MTYIDLDISNERQDYKIGTVFVCEVLVGEERVNKGV
jgi:hypothetical protein